MCPPTPPRQAHDGADYNEDPVVFTSFIVSVLEQGRKLYGVGVSRPVCLILDRGPYERNGVPKVALCLCGVRRVVSTLNAGLPSPPCCTLYTTPHHTTPHHTTRSHVHQVDKPDMSVIPNLVKVRSSPPPPSCPHMPRP